jgi:hypothetical protein
MARRRMDVARTRHASLSSSSKRSSGSFVLSACRTHLIRSDPGHETASFNMTFDDYEKLMGSENKQLATLLSFGNPKGVACLNEISKNFPDSCSYPAYLILFNDGYCLESQTEVFFFHPDEAVSSPSFMSFKVSLYLKQISHPTRPRSINPPNSLRPYL